MPCIKQGCGPESRWPVAKIISIVNQKGGEMCIRDRVPAAPGLRPPDGDPEQCAGVAGGQARVEALWPDLCLSLIHIFPPGGHGGRHPPHYPHPQEPPGRLTFTVLFKKTETSVSAFWFFRKPQPVTYAKSQNYSTLLPDCNTFFQKRVI